MKKTEEAIFKAVAQLLEQSVAMLENRITIIEGKNPPVTSSTANREADSATRLFKVRSLKLYKNTLAFLSKEITRDAPKHHFYLLPNTRKLFDVYARFIHLLKNCPDENKQALCCIAYQLMSYNALGNQVVYDQTLSSYKNLITEQGYCFPVFKDFDYIWYLRKSGLSFSSNRDLLQEQVVNKYSNPPVVIFKGKNLVGLYGMVSEICHGNPYFGYDGEYNERFWVATMSLMVTSYLIDLVDTYTLNKPLRKDFREWMADIDKVSRKMTELWATKRISKPSLP